MLRADEVVTALAGLCIPELTSLPLTDRVPRKDNIPALHQPLAQRVIMVLAVWCMSCRYENGRMFFGFASVGFRRHIEESSHIDSGKAFKNHLLDMKAIHWDSASDSGPQWSPDCRKPAHHHESLAPQLV